ncbi:unnamed protein product [Prorocentrum cordatum]|uniref:Uncharacterized protein n=1 Tax=Prorocentrum cordatum TaxID=2364126 RepID=A0ABN9R1L9_9DINO|nr:unnamed protein product [Polarella glacialis]
MIRYTSMSQTLAQIGRRICSTMVDQSAARSWISCPSMACSTAPRSTTTSLSFVPRACHLYDSQSFCRAGRQRVYSGRCTGVDACSSHACTAVLWLREPSNASWS